MFTTRAGVSNIGETPAIPHQEASGANSQSGVPASAAASAAPTAASASAASAASVASAEAPPTTTRSVLHAAAEAAAPAVAEPQAAPPYIAPMANVLMGVVASYLPGNDQLAFRQLDDATRLETDSKMEALKLTASEAAALFNSSEGLPKLKHVHLTSWTAAEFMQFATALASIAYEPFALTLPPMAWDGKYPLEVLDRLDGMALSELHLPGASVGPDEALRLSRLNCDITIRLLAMQPSALPASQINNVKSLDALNAGLSDEAAWSIGHHPTLTEFKAYQIASDKLLQILDNPRMTSLALTSGLDDETDEVIQKLADHPGITSLELGRLRSDRWTRLFGNTQITSLKTHAEYLPTDEMAGIANMHSLRAVTLHSSGLIQGVEVAQVADLCKKPLESLSFLQILMTHDALIIAAGANARALSFDRVATVNPSGQPLEIVLFNQAAVDAVIANPHVVSLSVKGPIVDGGAAQLAAAPGIQQLHLLAWNQTETTDSVQSAWVAAGKSLADLTVTMY